MSTTDDHRDEWIEPALALFREACELPQGERTRFLDTACREDAELRRHVEAMLAADDDQNTEVDDPSARHPLREALSDLVRQAEAGPAESAPLPEAIGDYRIVELIAHGGMGTVFLAEQRSPVRRHVALKVIKLGMDSQQIVARFELERQALAVMSHPTIAKVFDAGITEQGQPYFVMEFVEGTPLTDYCDEHQLSLEDRIGIFQQVCRGVQHAHQKGVVHRDLKPGNILVARKGDEHTVKIIDFGLARATDQQLLANTIYTEQGQLIGTPEYMSPEQASGKAIDIDTRTDVYSLGVMLYELLTGELPFTSQQLRQVGLMEIQRILAEVEPPKPSTRVSSAGKAASTWAQKRRISVPTLRRNLQGELDWIVLRAMAKEPERRYGSALGFALDLDRYLEDEPVEAGPPSASYRLSKFVRRYRVQVMAALLLVLALVAGVLGTTWYAFAAQRERDVADGLRQDSYDDVSRLAALADVHGEITDLKTRLVRMAARVVDGERPGFSDRITQFERRTNQEAPGGGGNFQELRDLLKEAAGLGAAKVAAADRMHARVRRAVFRPNPMRDLEVAAVEVAKLHHDLMVDLPSTDPRKVRARVLWLDSLNQSKEFLAAKDLVVTWRKEREDPATPDDYALHVPLHERIALYESRLGASLLGIGEGRDRAGEMLQRSVPIVVEAYPQTWYGNVAMANRLEWLQGSASKESVEAYRQEYARSLAETWNYGELTHSGERDLRLMIGDSYDELWTWWTGLERKRRLAASDIDDLELLRKKPGIVGDQAANHFIVSYLVGLVARQCNRQGEGDPVIWALHQVTFDHIEGGAKMHYAWIARIYEQRGICLSARGEHEAARRWFRQAVDVCTDVWLRAEFGGSLGSCLARMGRFAEAERRLLHARRVAVYWHGPGLRKSMKHLNDLVSMYRAWGKIDKAVEWHRIGVAERGYTFDHRSWAITCLHSRDWNQAVEQARLAMQARWGQNPKPLAFAHRVWARALLARGDATASLEHFEAGKLGGWVEGDGFWSDYGIALVKTGEPAAARKLLKSLTDRRESHPLAWQLPLAWQARARFLATTPDQTDADQQEAAKCEATAVEQTKALAARYK